MAATRNAVLLDLDGTLTDPFVGISTSMQYALEKMGRQIPPADDLRRYIGPPLQVTFPMLLGSDDPDLTAQALAHYRQRYSGPGKFENTLIPGIVDAVGAIAKQGRFLAVATSKLESYSIDIVEHFGLMPYFKSVHGSRLDGSNANKADLIRHIIATEGIDPRQTVMVGDRLHDVEGAATNGIRTIGVLWGFGDRAELERAGATKIATTPGELPRMVEDLIG